MICPSDKSMIVHTQKKGKNGLVARPVLDDDAEVFFLFQLMISSRRMALRMDWILKLG